MYEHAPQWQMAAVLHGKAAGRGPKEFAVIAASGGTIQLRIRSSLSFTHMCWSRLGWPTGYAMAHLAYPVAPPLVLRTICQMYS